MPDPIFWSPSDSQRPTQCLHDLGATLVKANKAVEFSQVGEGTLIVSDPSHDEPMAPLSVEVRDNG